MMTARETLYARAVQDVYDRLTVEEDHQIARAVMAVADDELAAVTKDRDLLAQAMWDARGILGFDNDGDATPAASIAGMGYEQFAGFFIEEAKQQRDDYDEVMDLWDGAERKDWTARAEKAEKDAAIYKDAFKDATMANTVSARKLAEQEAKTVEYRAAWLAAERTIEALKKRLRGNGGRLVHDHDYDPTCTEYLLGACVAGGE